MKCSKCGAELEGKFCTNCGAPAPTNPVCANCGTELSGKFCTKCGTPAPQNSDEASENQPQNNVQEVQPSEPVNAENETAPQNNDTAQPSVDRNPYSAQPEPVQYNQEPVPYTPEPVQYNQESAPYTPEPAQYNANPAQPEFQQNEVPQPVDYGTTPPNAASYGQQFTNQPSDGGYKGQQFTNQKSAPANGKKPMSGGKIAIIIVSIVLGLIIILGIIIGVVACNIVNNAADDLFNSSLSQLSSELSDYESSYNYNSDLYDDEDEKHYDEASMLYYEESDLYDGWKITGYDNYADYETSKITVVVPSQIDGRDVVEIDELAVYDNDMSDDGYIKIIIPGTVKVIDSYAMSFCEDINEVVIEDGVTTIEEDAFTGCSDLKKVTVPASVTEMDGCNIGFDCDDDYIDVPMSDFTLYGTKGSTAEKYAKENGLKFVEQ